eukprot:9565353-Lingulodinium_polyedra.AAC.1
MRRALLERREELLAAEQQKLQSMRAGASRSLEWPERLKRVTEAAGRAAKKHQAFAEVFDDNEGNDCQVVRAA